MVTAAVGPPLVIAVLFLVGAPLLAFLVLEQQISRASSRWKQRLPGELPIVTEQLGMLLGAGYSLTSTLNRLSQRSSGACAADLAQVCGRIRQGLDEQAALVEWARRVDVEALDRLVSVLALNRQAADLGRLISAEARAMRRTRNGAYSRPSSVEPNRCGCRSPSPRWCRGSCSSSSRSYKPSACSPPPDPTHATRERLLMITTWLWISALLEPRLPPRLATMARDDRGEGVISVAIAVLIMAFLGAAMWLGFQQMWRTTDNTTNTKVQQIGSE